MTLLSRIHLSRTHITALAGAAMLLGMSSMAAAQAAGAVAQDDASHYSTGSYNTGVSGGTGFGGPFTVSGPGGDFVGDSTKNGYSHGPGINTAGKAWGLFKGEAATRRFAKSLAAGQTLSLHFDNGLLANGLRDEVALLDTQGKTAATFGFVGGGQDYLLNGKDTGIKFTDGGVSVAFALRSATRYTVTIKRLADGKSATLPGTIAAGTALGGIRVTNGSTEGGAANDLYFNSLQVRATAKGE